MRGSAHFLYQPHIDGLRALAVLSVLIYHAFPGLMRGGFVGVDIFFVISGFLITSLIYREMQAGEFSYTRFLERRVRRLLPPLVPVMLFAWIASFLLVGDETFHAFVRSAYESMAFAANWYFYSAISYFDTLGGMAPLLHFWSLAVEEQFYFLFPFVLLAMCQCRPAWRAPMVAVLLMASLVYSQYLVSSGSTDLAFYNSASRFWELLAGCLLALIPAYRGSVRACTAMELIGILLILVAVFAYRSTMPFPGATAVVPVLGAVLIIAAAGQGSVIAPLLRSRVAARIGFVSYSLYLWHWPLLVGLHFVNPHAGGLARLLALVLAAVLATLSYRFIEEPIRRKQVFSSRRSIFLAMAVCMGMQALAIALSASAPLNEVHAAMRNRARQYLISSNVRQLDSLDEATAYYMAKLNINSDGSVPDQRYGDQPRTCSFDKGNSAENVLACLRAQAAERNVLVVGDSVGRDTWHALRRAYPDVRFLMVHQSSCPPSGQQRYPDKNDVCFPDFTQLMEKLRHSMALSAIVVSFNYDPTNWETAAAGLQALKDQGQRVLLFGVAPEFPQPLPELVRSLPKQASAPLSLAQPDPGMVVAAKAMAARYGVQFVDVAAYFCPAGSCRVWSEDGQTPLYFDHLHLTDAGITRYAAFLKSLSLQW